MSEKRIYTDEQYLDAIRNLANKLGRPPVKSDIDKAKDMPSFNGFRGRFGSWAKARELAGFPKKRLVQSDAIDMVISLSKQLGRTPTRKEARNFGIPVQNWGTIVSAAGLIKTRCATEQDLINSLKKVAIMYGFTPKACEFYRHPDGYSCAVVSYISGSYKNLLEKSGLPPRELMIGNWTKSSSLKAISDFYNSTGIIPITKILDSNPELPSQKTIVKLHRSLKKARQLADIPEPNKAPESKRITCKDGHIASSIPEEVVDNFLYDSGIDHQCQVPVCDDRDWTCDFVIGNLWIEIDGFNGARYGNIKLQFYDKINFYSENSMKFFICHPDIDGWQDKLLRAIHLMSS